MYHSTKDNGRGDRTLVRIGVEWGGGVASHTRERGGEELRVRMRIELHTVGA